MKRYKRIAIAGACVLGAIAGLRLLATALPVKLDGPEWNSIDKCATNQKWLYQSIESYVRENGKLPDADFQINGFPARVMWECPSSGKGYALHPENYGNRHAAVIIDEQNRHPTTVLWWARGFHPHVQTMGDGTIHRFQGGKILTMVGSTKRKQRGIKPYSRLTSKTEPAGGKARAAVQFTIECLLPRVPQPAR